MANDLDHRPLFRSSTPTSPASPAEPTSTITQPAAEPEPKKLDLSLTQLVGGALAAMTAAALGSRIGVAGTVIGAAVASVIAGLGGALYTASLRRTRDTVRMAWRGRAVPTTVTTVAPPSRYPGVAAAVAPAQPAAPSPKTGGRTKRRWWPRVLIGAVASFGIAAGALTTVEILTGHALSGGSGTTIQQVQRGSSDQPQAQEPTESAASATPEPTSEPVPSSAPSASASPSPEPTASSSPSATTPTPEPSASTSESASTSNERSPAADEVRTGAATS